MANYKKLGQRIRQLRREKDLTQERLAELTHLDLTTITAIEAGRQNPTVKTLAKIAKVLKASIDILEFI